VVVALIACGPGSLSAPEAANAGAFQVTCTFSHRLMEDPIVFPGQAGASHWHDFYGAETAGARSTYRSMLASPSTCADKRDTAGYWHPRLWADGAVRRGTLVAYYDRGNKPSVRAYPPNLKVVAGSARATAPQPRHVSYWSCTRPSARGLAGASSGAPRGARSTSVPRCARGTHLTSNVVFPDCWDNRRLDAPDHASHMAYAAFGACPASHPVGVPRLVVSMRWDVRPRGGAAVRLSSGPAWTMHADFWNTWQQRRLRALVNECLNLTINCGEIRDPR